MKLLILASFLFTLSAFATEIDTQKSSFKWTGTKLKGHHSGTIKLKSSKLTVEKNKIKSGEFVMDLSTITVGDLRGEWKKKFETHIKSPDFFNIKKFPTAILVVNSVDAKNLSGTLTIKGKTQPVKMKYTLKDKTYNGTLKFNRTKFDMIYKSGNFFKDLGDKLIHDEVTLAFKVVVK